MLWKNMDSDSVKRLNNAMMYQWLVMYAVLSLLLSSDNKK